MLCIVFFQHSFSVNVNRGPIVVYVVNKDELIRDNTLVLRQFSSVLCLLSSNKLSLRLSLYIYISYIERFDWT